MILSRTRKHMCDESTSWLVVCLPPVTVDDLAWSILGCSEVHGLLTWDMGGSTLFVTTASTETLNGTIVGVTFV